MGKYSDKYVIVVAPCFPPIPTNKFDYEAHIDGNEEDGSCFGPTKWDAVRALIDTLEMREDR